MRGGRVQRWWGRLRSPAVADALLAVAFAGIAVVDRVSGDQYVGGPLAVDIPMTALVVGLLALRRVAPMRVLVLTCAVVVLPTCFVHHDFLIWSHLLPLLIDVYTVARHRPMRWAVVGAVLVAASVELVLWVDTPDPDPGTALVSVLVLAPLLGGSVLRRNAERRRAIAAALGELEAQAAARRRLALLQERTRVARDLHDVVAHAVSLMTIQAEVAGAALGRDPAGAERSVLALEAAGRAATGELRRMLGLLRAGDGDSEPGGPAPDLDGLDALVARMQEAGLRVSVEVDGERPPLPAGFEVNAYRIVQEALTNARTHAGPVEARLLLRYGQDVVIEVLNEPPAVHGDATAPAGHGLLGMRERVALLGGSMSAGPERDGFAVRVRLPVPEPA